MKYDAILFDLDGTLLNTLDDLRDSVNYVMETMGYPTHSLEAIRSFVGNGIRNLMIHATPDGESNPRFEEGFKLFQEYYLTHNQIKTRPYDGIMDMLDALQKRQMPMAIVTNKNQPTVDVLLRDVFDGLVPFAIGDNGIRERKPSAEPVLEAIRRLNIENGHVLYVGDSEVDAATAKAAGIDLVLCSWGFREKSLLETFESVALIDEPQELLELL